MEIYRTIDEIKAIDQPVVTVGGFDGLHLGHQKIIACVKSNAIQLNGASVLTTFHPHPRFVVHPEDKSLRLLNTLEEKIALAEKAGLDHLLVIPFTNEFSGLSYLQFIERILVEKLHLKKLILGFNHHFGKNREGDLQKLIACSKTFGFEVEEVDARTVDGSHVSSSRIREALMNGQTEEANKLLGYRYRLEGVVVDGIKKGRELGFPTANIQPVSDKKLVPAIGIYAVTIAHHGKTYNGVASIGTRPTFGLHELTIEVHLFDFDQRIYGDLVQVEFVSYIRQEIKFGSIEALVREMKKDKEIAARLLLAHHLEERKEE